MNYLLNLDHGEGGSKAKFFARFGFIRENWEVLQAALRSHVIESETISVSPGIFGTKYEVAGPLKTPDGRNPIIISVWIIENGLDYPRLVTAYPS